MYSIQQATSDGSLNTIAVSIKYFDKTDISVYVDDLLLPDGTYTYTWSANNVVITPNVANASVVKLKRSTKFDTPYHDFSAGAVFKDSTVDDNFTQMLYLAQETSEGATTTDFYNNLNFHGYRLRKVGAAVEDDDAVPFSQYRADALGAYQQRVLAESAKSAAQASQAAAAASATASATSATNAASSASAAASSATNASSSASAASTSATGAAGSATSAAASASAASTSATNAANSASAAAASAASIDPTTIVRKDSDTGAAQLPTGTTAQRPANAAGRIRYNSDLGRFEGNNGSAWGSMGGAQGGGSDDVFFVNNQTVTADYTVASGKNAMSAGPITINNGVTVTVSSGSVWTVV